MASWQLTRWESAVFLPPKHHLLEALGMYKKVKSQQNPSQKMTNLFFFWKWEMEILPHRLYARLYRILLLTTPCPTCALLKAKKSSWKAQVPRICCQITPQNIIPLVWMALSKNGKLLLGRTKRLQGIKALHKDTWKVLKSHCKKWERLKNCLRLPKPRAAKPGKRLT